MATRKYRRNKRRNKKQSRRKNSYSRYRKLRGGEIEKVPEGWALYYNFKRDNKTIYIINGKEYYFLERETDNSREDETAPTLKNSEVYIFKNVIDGNPYGDLRLYEHKNKGILEDITEKKQIN